MLKLFIVAVAIISGPNSFASKPQKPAKPTSVQILEQSLTANQLDDLLTLRLPSPSQKLVLRLKADEFGSFKPFGHLKNYYAFGEILSKGVVSFNRTSYRSPQFVMAAGYDLVKYEIIHDDQTKTFILAYGAQSAGKKQNKVLVFTRGQSSQIHVITYSDGVLDNLERVEMDEVKKTTDGIIRSAMPVNLTSIVDP